MQELTVKEALEQGYEYYVYASEGFQPLSEISSTEIDFTRGEIRLVAKEASTACAMSAEDLAELIAEHHQCLHYDLSGDDDETNVYDAIKKIDFTDVVFKIEAAIKHIQYYSALEIKLIP